MNRYANTRPCKSRHCRSATEQSGAVLLMVLVVIVSLSIAIAVASRIINQRLVTAQDSKQSIDVLMQSEAKIAELTYLLATQKITVAGVSTGRTNASAENNEEEQQLGFSIQPIGDEIRTDGYTYTQGNLHYSIQNEAGLLAINSPEQMWLERYLNRQGFSRLKVQSLLDSLADYADENDSRRAAGAESFAYNGASANTNSDAPRNYLLQSCGELALVKQWQELPTLVNKIDELCSTSRSPLKNMNSMPLPLLQAMFPQQAEQIWLNRENGNWLITESELVNSIPSILNVSPEYYSVVSGFDYSIYVGDKKEKAEPERVRLKLGIGNLAPFTFK